MSLRGVRLILCRRDAMAGCRPPHRFPNTLSIFCMIRSAHWMLASMSLSVRGLPCGVPNRSSAVCMCRLARIAAMIPITRFRPSSMGGHQIVMRVERESSRFAFCSLCCMKSATWACRSRSSAESAPLIGGRGNDRRMVLRGSAPSTRVR